MQTNPSPDRLEDYCGTTYAAKLLGLSVGTIQTLVEKNELQAWKTQGGHRRISMPSIREYQRKHNMVMSSSEGRESRLKVLLVEDDELLRDGLSVCHVPHLPASMMAKRRGSGKAPALRHRCAAKPPALWSFRLEGGGP